MHLKQKSLHSIKVFPSLTVHCTWAFKNHFVEGCQQYHRIHHWKLELSISKAVQKGVTELRMLDFQNLLISCAPYHFSHWVLACKKYILTCVHAWLACEKSWAIKLAFKYCMIHTNILRKNVLIAKVNLLNCLFFADGELFCVVKWWWQGKEKNECNKLLTIYWKVRWSFCISSSKKNISKSCSVCLVDPVG